MAPYSSTFAQKILWMEEPGTLQSMGSLGVRHHRATSLSLFTFMHWRRKWQPTPVFLPGECQGRGSLVGCRLWGHRVGLDWSDLAPAAADVYIGEGNGNPLQCSCLENPRDGGAWWAAVYGVAQSRTRLTRLSSSSKVSFFLFCSKIKPQTFAKGFEKVQFGQFSSKINITSLNEKADHNI